MAAVDWDAATAALALANCLAQAGSLNNARRVGELACRSGHGHCKGAQGQLRLTSKIGSEEKEADRLSLVCPVSVPIRLAARPKHPGDSGILDISAIGRRNGHPA